jgi:type IV secretory pathway VirB10-like protein
VLVWNRLIFPNGWSISLRGMEGADPTGAAGLRDRVDNHLDRLAGAIGLSAIISVIADNAEDDDETRWRKASAMPRRPRLHAPAGASSIAN